MTTSIKLGIAGCIVAAVTGYMAYVGTAASWKFYVTVDECLAEAPAFTNQRVRVSGRVLPGSLDIGPGRRGATFRMKGRKGGGGELPVICTGLVPDNLEQDMEVVVEGYLDESGVLRGNKVMTRCASKYTSESDSAVGGRSETANPLCATAFDWRKPGPIDRSFPIESSATRS